MNCLDIGATERAETVFVLLYVNHYIKLPIIELLMTEVGRDVAVGFLSQPPQPPAASLVYLILVYSRPACKLFYKPFLKIIKHLIYL